MLRDRKFDEREERKVIKKRERKVYLPPRLIEYGHVEKLTQGAQGTGNEAGGRSFR